MPRITVIDYPKARFYINTNDHEPPHVHVESRDGRKRLKVEIGTGKVFDNIGFRQSEVSEIVNAVICFQSFILEVWNETRPSK